MFYEDVFLESKISQIDKGIDTAKGIKENVDLNVNVIKSAFKCVIGYLTGFNSYQQAKADVHKAVTASRSLYCESLAYFFMQLEVNEDIEWDLLEVDIIEKEADKFKNELLPQISAAVEKLL